MSSNQKSQESEENSPRSHTVGLRVPIDLYRELKSIAEAERRSVSNYLLRLIEADLNEHALKTAQQATFEGPYAKQGIIPPPGAGSLYPKPGQRYPSPGPSSRLNDTPPADPEPDEPET